MARDITDTQPISSKAELMSWFEAGCKPKTAFAMGVEHEKFPFYRQSLKPVPYLGTGPVNGDGIAALLIGLQEKLGWEPILEQGHIIGLSDEATKAAISLEPGGQFELSGAPVKTVHDVGHEFDAHIAALKHIANPLGIDFLLLGMTPDWQRQDIPVMPKRRYQIMAGYMPKVGTRGLDMMFRTCTVQVNLDFASEQDMVQKLRVSLALQPLATALFANSPFTDGAPNGFLSARSHIWLDTDKARSGMLPFAFESSMGFERYVDYALDVPMYFVKRGETYHDVTGQSFRDLLAGKLPGLPGAEAYVSDFANHLSTIFPEVRLKRYLEMRGADVGGRAAITALPALFVGLLYDDIALDGAWQIVKGWRADERQALREAVPREGLAAKIQGRSLREIGLEVLALAKAGLIRRGHLNAARQDESHYLAVLDDYLQTGENAAAKLLKLYHTDWQNSVKPVYDFAKA